MEPTKGFVTISLKDSCEEMSPEALGFLTAIALFIVLMILLFLYLNNKLSLENTGELSCLDEYRKNKDSQDHWADVRTAAPHGEKRADSGTRQVTVRDFPHATEPLVLISQSRPIGNYMPCKGVNSGARNSACKVLAGNLGTEELGPHDVSETGQLDQGLEQSEAGLEG
ncbi:synaptotagmin-14-like [Arapaima gigas]